jgi:hypothetical protein
MLSVRVAKQGVEAITNRSEAEAVDRSEMLRRMLAYATQNMPRGWKP